MEQNETELNQPLVWIDLEMTGLDPKVEKIVEIAAIITDGSLETIIEGPQIVISCEEEILENMVDVVVNMHTSSGLLDDIRKSTTSVQEAEAEVLAFIKEHIPTARLAPLAGNSIHADKAFLKEFMPDLTEHLHYRHVDVSTVKELAKRWNPEIAENEPEKEGNHRALADIRDSIEQLKYYRKNFIGN